MAAKTTLKLRNNPLTAKARFKMRAPYSWLRAIACFIALALLYAVTFPKLQLSIWWAWVADVLTIAGLLIVFTLFWRHQPIRVFCKKCEKEIETNIPWICGFKQCRNESIDQYPMVNRCEHCGAEAKAYECHHCGDLIFFTTDEFKRNYARCTRASGVRDDLEIPDLERNRQKAALELEIAQFDKTLGKFAQKDDLYDEDKRRRANEDEEMDHQMHLIKKRAVKAQAEANVKALEDANLPERERAQKRRDRVLEKFDTADEGRALVEKRWPKDSKQYAREMAFWKAYEEDQTIRM